MSILKATRQHKTAVLKLLDDFRTACHKIINPSENFISNTARENGGPMFDQVVDSPTSAIFLAEENGRFIGIATVNAIPQVRYGRFIAEIEEMFVYPEFQGKGASRQLMDAIVTWAKEKDIKSIRLESGVELERAHGFYEKMGFRHYAKGYEKKL